LLTKKTTGKCRLLFREIHRRIYELLHCHGNYLRGIMRDLSVVRPQMRHSPEKHEEGIGMPPKGDRGSLMPFSLVFSFYAVSFFTQTHDE